MLFSMTAISVFAIAWGSAAHTMGQSSGVWLDTPSSDLEWVRWVLLDVSPSGLNTDHERAMARLGGAGDTVEWYMGIAANARDQMRRRGIPTSGAEQYEYEESLQFTPNEVWEHFGVDGAAMNESVLPPLGGFGGRPTMTNIAPKWAEQVRQGLLRPALFGDCVTQDNVGAPLYGPPNGCCDLRSNAIFLKRHGERLGLPTNFSMGPYIQQARKHGLSGVALVQEEVVREIVRFHFVTNLERWQETYSAIKADARENDRPEPVVYGNVHIVENVYSVVVSQHLDVVWTETPAFLPHVGAPPTWGGAASGFSALQYKLGRASGNFSKPHWGIVTLTGCGLKPAGFPDQTMTAVLASAEALANGAVAAQLFGDTLPDDPCYPSTLEWSSFVDQNRYLFGPDRVKQADIAILYSVPTRMWLQDTSMVRLHTQNGSSQAVPFAWTSTGEASLPLSDVFSGVARVLEDHHLLYDVLIMDHPDLSKFDHLRRLLSQFRVAVLPVVLAMSDEDARLLAAWVRGGGILVAVDWEHTAMYDEDLRSRPVTAASLLGGSRCHELQELITHPGSGTVRKLNKELRRYAFKGYHDTADDAAIAMAMTPPTMVDLPAVLSTENLPSTVWVNVWIHGAGFGPMRSIHLVNYNGNASTNTIRPVLSAFTLKLRCVHGTQPEGPFGCENITNASIVCPGTHAVPLVLNRTDFGTYSMLHVSVPANTMATMLGVVVFSVLGEEEVRAAAAVARKSLERLRIASRSRGLDRHDFAKMIDGAQSSLMRVQAMPLTISALRDGVEAFKSMAVNLTDQLENRITNVLENAATCSQDGTISAGNASGVLIALAAAAPAATEWQTLSPTSASNDTAAYSWSPPTGGRNIFVSPDANSTDMLHASFIGGTLGTTSTLHLKLPQSATTGIVTVISGSFDTGRQAASTALLVTGAVGKSPTAQVSLPGAYDFSGYFRHIAFRFNSSTTTTLNITLSAGATGHFYGDGYGEGLHTLSWILNAVLVTAGDTPPTPEAHTYLTLSEGLAATQLLHWKFIGPFQDPHFTARERVLGPERWPVDYNETYDDGAGHLLHWQQLEVQRGISAPTPMCMPAAASALSVNATVAAVLCTHLSLPSAATPTLEVMLRGSSSALAEITLNNESVASDRLITGLHMQEIQQKITLARGRTNHLCVKAFGQMSWATTWTLALSLTSVGWPRQAPAVVPGLTTRP